PFSTTGAEVTIAFEGENLQSRDDESWGIDNVRILAGSGIGPATSTDCNNNAIPDECEMQQSRLYVNVNAEGGDTGFSWDDAFTDLQDALKFAECAKDGAEPITEIWVADGVYVPGDNESASFALVDNVGLYGGFAGGETELEQRDPQANVAVLSGDILGDDDGSDSAKSDNSTHVVTADRVSGAGFDGFTVTGGTANGHGGSQSRTGGGLWINGTAGGEGPTVVNSRFVDNHAADGGGAVYSTADGAIFIRCEFVGNEAVSGNGGAVAVAGGGTGNEEPNFVSCLFRDNQCGASDQGGGLFITSTGGGVVVRNCVFAHNVAGSGGGLALGGSVLSSPKQILNSTFAYNTVRREGGGINSTVDVTATNCVFWNNSRGDIVDADAQVSFDTLRSQLRFSLVHGGIWGPDEDGNISDQGAQVLDADSRLGADSPAIDAGDNQAVEEIPYDKDGHPRVLVGRPDPLDPPTPTVDMGAYEFADCDGNGTHDVEQIEADPTKDCDEDLVLDDCVLSAPFEAHSGDLGPIGVGQPRSFFAGTINPARGDVVVTVTARADLEADDTEYLDVIIISRTGESDEHRPVFKLAGADDCTEVTSSVRFEESTFNRLFPTAGQGGDRGLVIKIDASDTVAPDACGDDGSVSVSVSFDERINDCQLNNRLDACDIADPNGSNDLDGDGVPDECRNDCNANGVTDECDLDCLAEGCDVSTCGTKSDCNRNGRPDECEVACIDGQACHCFSGCDPDCNMNGLPDECDVGDPDEPSRWVGGHSCVDNNGEPISGFECWDIAANWCPDTVPDNLSGTKFTVEVAGQENAPTVVTMDISPTITRLDLGPYASVGVDQASGALVRTLAAEAERPVDEGPDPIENAGTLFARDGRRLVLDAEAINQSVGEGALEATGVHPVNESPSIVEVNGATVIGGRATTTDGGEIHLIGGAELQDVEVDGVLVPNGQTGAFSGSVFNKGLLEVGRGGPEGALFRPDGQENNLAPGGGDCSSPDNCVVRLGGQTTAMLGNFKLPFVNETDHKIEGAGVIFGEMTNNGKIHANRAGEQLILFPTGPKSNNGDLMATADATLRIADAVYQSGTGRIRSHTVCGSVLIEAPVTGEGSFLASGSTAKRGGCVPPPAQMSISTGLSTEGSTLRVTDGALVEFEASSTMALAQTMEIDSGGRVRGSGELAEPPTALSAGRLHISNSGALELSKNMHFGLYCRGTYRGVAAARGGCVPPPAIVELGGALVAKDASSVDIDGTIRLQTGGQIEVGCRAAFSVGENLDNLLIDPTTFDWARGSLLMDGDQILLEGQQQRLEAAGKDRGPVASGFVNNFAFGTLELAPGAVVEVADAFDNPQDGLEVCDAVYVRRLVVGPGATVDAPGCKIYYTALENLGTIFTLGESVIEVVVDGDWDTNGIVDLADYAGFFSCMAGPWCQDGPARPSELCLNTFDF
ncbi:MAG: choice-of-anchor Q domain-containing protein, partial [Phycisphaerae bacterium]